MTSKYIFVLFAVILLVLATTSADSLDHAEIPKHLKGFFKIGAKNVKPEGKERAACWGRGTTAATTTAATTTTTAAAGR
ncbi:hypothetical protein WA026_019874 [Henosepilachna vigintioctopunctata]|uniref:Uncharacterized protein n=1 Tax=Henosepilachna vigintioctopunctata TaxID=420089 RepID=A0AAW1VIY1_9CUCU